MYRIAVTLTSNSSRCPGVAAAAWEEGGGGGAAAVAAGAGVWVAVGIGNLVQHLSVE